MAYSWHLILGASVVWIAVAQPALASEAIPGGKEKFKFMLGGIVARIDSSVGLNGTTDEGTEIDLDSPTGKKEANNVFFGAEWRVAPRHRISGIYFTTKKERTLSFNNSVTIGDETLVPPATLESVSRNRFLFATYQYSFVTNDDVEIAGLLGAYINKFNVDLTGNATVVNSSGTTTINKTLDFRPSVTVPMPLIGVSIKWYASPKFTVGGSLSGLKAKIGDVDGGVYVANVSAEYMITRNVGAGLVFMHTDADVDISKRTFNGSIDWKNDNLLLYALLKF